MGNNFCPTCGNSVENNERFCEKCGEKLEFKEEVIENKEEVIDEVIDNKEEEKENNTIVNNNVVNNTQKNIEKDDSKGTNLGVISLLLYYVAPIVMLVISSLLPDNIDMLDYPSILGSLCGIAGFVMMIVGAIKYPNNKMVVVNKWIIIGSIIAWVQAFLFILILLFTGHFQV